MKTAHQLPARTNGCKWQPWQRVDVTALATHDTRDLDITLEFAARLSPHFSPNFLKFEESLCVSTFCDSYWGLGTQLADLVPKGGRALLTRWPRDRTPASRRTLRHPRLSDMTGPWNEQSPLQFDVTNSWRISSRVNGRDISQSVSELAVRTRDAKYSRGTWRHLVERVAVVHVIRPKLSDVLKPRSPGKTKVCLVLHVFRANINTGQVLTPPSLGPPCPLVSPV